MPLKSFAKVLNTPVEEQITDETIIDQNDGIETDDNIEAVDTLQKFEVFGIIDEMEGQYPEMTAEYKRIMKSGYETFCLKMSNYGVDNISLGSSLEKEEDRKLSLIGLWFRISDKIQRLKQLTVIGKKDNVGETITETYQDLSVYAILAQLVTSGKWGK